jgi:ubiquinone/menaquinone biosynthesis C-methylase UbiE
LLNLDKYYNHLKSILNKTAHPLIDDTTKKIPTYHLILLNDLMKYTHIPKKRILVVGCGTGVECDLLRKQGAQDVVGLDIKDDIGIDYPHPNIQYVKGSAEDIQFDSNEFNLVASFATLEHIPNPQTALEEMIRVTARNGVFYCFAAPLWNSPFGHHKKHIFPNDPWIHIRKKSPKEMKNFYGDFCDMIIEDFPISEHIDYIYSSDFNRFSIKEYKAITAKLLHSVSPISIHFKMNLEHRSLFTKEIIKELVNYSEEELLTDKLSLVFRKL